MKNTLNKQDEYVSFDEKTQNEVASFHDFGVCDEQNRSIGSRIITYDVNRTETKRKDGFCCKKKDLGVFYVFIPSATRNKKIFGAYQGERYFRTQKERSDEIKKYLESSRRRYIKKFNK